MNGAESLLRSAADAGYDVCFANPGTTEMPLVAALDSVREIRPVLGLFEGVCTGAADGYARVAGKPALALLHLAPGLANGLANLHNARRADSPMVVLIGEHTTWHRPFDPPLAGDIEGLARAISPTAWVATAKSAQTLADDFVAADRAAREQPGRLAFLIVPADAQWEEPAEARRADAREPVPAPSASTVEGAAQALRRHGARGAVWLGGSALGERGVHLAGRIAAATECRIATGSFPTRCRRGGGLPLVARLPYFPEPAMAAVKDLDCAVLVEAQPPVTFFGYPEVPSEVLPEACERRFLAAASEDGVAALEALADALDAPPSPAPAANPKPERPSGPLDPVTFSRTVASVQPEDAIVVDEALTSSTGYWEVAAAAPRYDHLCITGGAIGMGIPAALGAALAAPERPVLSLQADGSALYTLQGLWSQAREGLNVTTVLCSNRRYRILEVELDRAKTAPSEVSRTFTGLDRPDLSWCQLAEGFGVEAERVASAEALAEAIQRSVATPGPRLIEAEIV